MHVSLMLLCQLRCEHRCAYISRLHCQKQSKGEEEGRIVMLPGIHMLMRAMFILADNSDTSN